LLRVARRSPAIDPTPNRAVSLAHFSDIHVTTRPCRWRLEDWFGKRLAAWANLRFLGRGFRFRQNDDVLRALRADLSSHPIDRVVFSGDATALGFEEEMALAARLLGVDDHPGLAIPGNHDYCTRSAVRAGHFERHFGPWLRGQRVTRDEYPFAQKVGHVWLVAVNSATSNRWPWDASGAVGDQQLGRLQSLLASLPGNQSSEPRILVTHYPVRLANGRPELRLRRLRDLEALLDVVCAGGVGLWLHGHRHDPYFHEISDRVPFPVICAGSATQSGHWSWSHYTIVETRLEARRRIYNPDEDRFVEAEGFELDLPCPREHVLA
jgi:3',5'-cyclic AMP phosphodiesterase CpdA